jgi:hypothetical protein
MPTKNAKYDKEAVELQCLLSKTNNRITEPLGRYILDRCNEIASSYFDTKGNAELRQALVDEAVMRICDKFLIYYDEGKSGANLIISMAMSTMLNKIKSMNWSDVYGEKRKSFIYIFDDGQWTRKLMKVNRDDNLSQLL